jgi:predicted nucleotidyltransferase
MNPNDPNVALIETAASALGEFLDRVVFIGGCAVGLMITDTARPAVRATQDVDLIVEIGSKAEYCKLSKQLREAGLKEDQEVVCRWRLGALKIDVIPTDEEVLGFSNRWYPEAMRDARTVALPSGLEIRLISSPLLLATKIEAFYDRGGGDFGASHDIEDIVNLIDGRPELTDEIGSATNEVRNYLREEFDDLLGSPFVDVITWHLGPQPEDQARAEIVIQRMRVVAGL